MNNTASKKALKTWEIVLIVLGAPLWLPLLIAVASIIISLYIVIWSLIISLWAVLLSLFLCLPAGIALSVVYFTIGYSLPGIAVLGLALFSGGISIFFFFGCVWVSKGVVRLTKKIALWIKSCFVKGRV